MGKYYCDYCDVFLTHDSQSVRKAHNSGRNHIQNMIDYYNGLGHNQAQDIIDQITRQYESGGPGMGGGFGGPPGGGFGGFGGGAGGPPVMRSAGPPPGAMMGPPGGFRPPPNFPSSGMPPAGMPPAFVPPGAGYGAPPAPSSTGYSGGPSAHLPVRPPPTMQNGPGFGGPGLGAGPSGQADGGFTAAAPGAVNGRPPMINPERMRMLGMG